MKLTKEIWKDIPEWEGLYAISTCGYVKSLRRDKLLKPNHSTSGYPQVWLADAKNNRRWITQIHILMAHSFMKKRPKGNVIRHMDGDKLNNHLDNLQYGTRQQNKDDDYYHGKGGFGQIKNLRMATAIKHHVTTGMKAQDAADKFGVSLSSVYCLKSGKSWKRVGIIGWR